MDSHSEYEEIDDFIPKSLIKMYHKTKYFKKTSETVSTNNCTIEFDKPFTAQSPLKKSSRTVEGSISCKNLNKLCKDLPDRLNSLRQITENKIKFMRVEKVLKELSDCTFKPKINNSTPLTSSTNFSKKQKEYKKLQNSKAMQLKFQYSASNFSCSSTPLLAKTLTTPLLAKTLTTPLKKNSDPVHERLYKDSKLFSKKIKHRKNF